MLMVNLYFHFYSYGIEIFIAAKSKNYVEVGETNYSPYEVVPQISINANVSPSYNGHLGDHFVKLYNCLKQYDVHLKLTQIIWMSTVIEK